MLKHLNTLQFGFLLLMTLTLANCKSSKTSSDNMNIEADKEMLLNGYHKGTIVDYSAEKGCTFLIKKEDTGELLLPLKLEDQFLQNNLAIWFKYQYSRRQQGTCLKGITITLGEIKMRE